MGPLIVGLVPFGLTVGATAARSESPFVGWASSILLYGGSGQLALLGGLEGGGSWPTAVVAAAVVNAHLLMVSMGLRERWRDQARWWRVACAYLIVSPLLAATGEHDRAEPDAARRRAFTLAAGMSLWASWLVLTTIGMVVGGALSGVVWLGLVTPLVLVAMAWRSVVDRPEAVALVSGALGALVASRLVHGQAFVIGGLTGVLAGTVVGGLRDRSRSDGA